MFLRSALLIAGAGLAVAESLSISSSCSSALLAVAGSSDATCLDIGLLAPLVASNSSTSIIPTINTWLTGLCSQGPCSNATLQAVVTNITNGCSGDLSGRDLTSNNMSRLVTFVEAVYPTFRQIACLNDASTNTLCTTELLTDIQSATTTLYINNIVGLIKQAIYGAKSTIPQSVTCSNCSKAAYTIAAQNFPALTNNQTTVQSECGSSFTDGQMPSGIQETASNSTSTSTSTSGATSLSIGSLSVGVTTLIAISSAFTLFA